MGGVVVGRKKKKRETRPVHECSPNWKRVKEKLGRPFAEMTHRRCSEGGGEYPRGGRK